MLRRTSITSLAAALALTTLALPAAAQDPGSSACPDEARAATFEDVSEGNVHAAAIDCAVALGLLEGTGDASFDPGGELTRGQTATLLAAAFAELDLPLPPLAGAPTFSDVGTTHAEAIRRLAAVDVLLGRGDGTFDPDAAVTRAQLASILVRAWEFVSGEVADAATAGFDDVGDNVHGEDVAVAAELGLLLGRDEDTFAPAATTRRDQAATVLVRVLDRAPAHLLGEVWSLDQGTDRIHIFDGADDEELTVIDVSPEALQDAGFDAAPTGESTVPHMIEFDSQERYAFIASTAGQVTLVVDARSKEVVEVLATGAGSHMAAVTPDDSAVWVAAIGAQQMIEIPLDLDADEPSFAIGRRLDVEDLLAPVEDDNDWAFPSYSPVCHQYSTDSSEAWITLGPAWSQGGFFVLDLESGTVTDAWDPAVVKANCGISVSDDIAIANWSGQVVEGDDTNGEWYVFDADSKELLDTRDAQGYDAHGLRLTPDGSAYWMVNRASDNALVIDAETLDVVEEYEDIAIAPDILDFNADGSRIYISQRGPNPRSGAIHAATGTQPGVAIVDTSTGETIDVLEAEVIENDEGVQLNDVHGVGFRNRGDGEPLAD